jgi:hypothetical protein
MAAGSSSAASRQTYGIYMHRVPMDLINNEEFLRQTLNNVYPGGYELEMGEPGTTALVRCTQQEPADLQGYLQDAGVILTVAP